MEQIITFDIDGVLNFYPQCWVDYINYKMKTNFHSKEECINCIGKDKYNLIKDEYRRSDYKANLEPRISMVNIINRLKEIGYSINIITSRPIHDKVKYPKLEYLTRNWLHNNNISYNKLIYKFDNKQILGLFDLNYICHIDDQINHGLFFAENNIITIIFGDIRDYHHKNIYFINNSKEIFSFILNIKKDGRL